MKAGKDFFIQTVKTLFYKKLEQNREIDSETKKFAWIQKNKSSGIFPFYVWNLVEIGL